MSLAARCPACGTVFRVVQDQLRVSEGWVRCGRCAEVFNAIETLVDLDTETGARAATAVSPPPPPRGASTADRVLEDLARVSQTGELDETAAAPPPARKGAGSRARMSSADAPAGVDLEVPIETPAAAPPRTSAQPPENTDDLPRLTPAFVVQAERAARWRRPSVRIALAAVSLAGLALLAVQALLEYRDTAAARWPGLAGALGTLCEWRGCSVGAPRAIDGLTVDSSGLVRADGAQSYRLTVVLRNRLPMAVAVPAVDLILTDTQGAVIARRVVRPADIGVRQTSVPPQGDLPLQALLVSPERPISGYTIEIFYP